MARLALDRWKRDGKQSHLLVGLIFGAHRLCLKISPSPLWAMCTAEKRGGGLIFGRIWYNSASIVDTIEVVSVL